MHKLKHIIILVFVFCCLTKVCFSQEMTILYTGETHASLYPCHCPVQPDGGLARRAAKIKEIRQTNPNVLLFDSGGFFAGGVVDGNSQNTELDKLRTQLTLTAMDIIGYDAVAVGDDEFNFGNNFLFDEISHSNISFLSSNIKSEKFLTSLIKEVGGVKVGIFALSPQDIELKSGLSISQAKETALQTISFLKGKGVSVVILLSHLGEDIDTKLAEEISGIDILVTGHAIINKKDAYTKVDSTILLRPALQGRRLGRCDITIENKKIVNFKVEQIRLSSDITDDLEIKKIIPECFSDNDCKKQKLIGKCLSPATDKAKCEFSEPAAVDLTIIRPTYSLLDDNTALIIEKLKKLLPNLNTKYIDYPSKKADVFIEKLKIKMLPAYILPKEIENSLEFSKLVQVLDKNNEVYLAKPSFSGVSFFVGRKKIKNRVDVFLTLKEDKVDKLLELLKEITQKHRDKIDLNIHFIAFKEGESFRTLEDGLIEEYLRNTSIMYNYPLTWWDYVICRVKDMQNSWWDDCLLNMDMDLIKTQANFEQGRELLRENIKLTEELQITNSPTFLLENREVFSTRDVPSLEEIEEVVFK